MCQAKSISRFVLRCGKQMLWERLSWISHFTRRTTFTRGGCPLKSDRIFCIYCIFSRCSLCISSGEFTTPPLSKYVLSRFDSQLSTMARNALSWDFSVPIFGVEHEARMPIKARFLAPALLCPLGIDELPFGVDNYERGTNWY